METPNHWDILTHSVGKCARDSYGGNFFGKNLGKWICVLRKSRPQKPKKALAPVCKCESLLFASRMLGRNDDENDSHSHWLAGMHQIGEICNQM